MKKQWIIIVAIAVLTVLAVFQSSTPTGNKEELPKEGYKAPQISLNGLDGKTYSFESLNGKPVIINFWASWCGPCKTEAPDLVRTYEKYSKQIEIYAVNITAVDSLDEAKAFVAEYGFSFPVLLDLDGSVTQRYQVKPIPTTFFVNGKGIITDQVIGAVDPQDMERKIKRLIK
ncbi:TlpA family protein disulfide reductase [Paenibacillus sp. MAHUQ-46]|uniref:TlpA family protein disulfide reductase n=1 Tax=Paenibacillus roseus TaxID=2798579 RepID=A0A934J3C8_9BACL|nr:TlpA family protein disulfide reductase [Paenibacillus roseus]